MLRLADAANRRKIPIHLTRQCGLGDQLLAAEQALGVIPLAAGVDIFTAGEEFAGANDAGGVLHPGRGARVDGHRLVIGGIGPTAALGGEKSVEIPFPRQLRIVAQQIARARVGQLGAAQLPVTPAAVLLQMVGHAAGQILHGVPTTGAQGEPGTPFGNGVVFHLRVIGGHERQCFRLMPARQTHTDIPGQRQALLFSERQLLIVRP